MIAWLKGEIQGRGEGYVVVVVGGQVGYKVFLPPSPSLWEKIEEGTEREFFVVHTFSENDQRLYGFETGHEKRVFELLLTVSGIGPKSASGLLGKISSMELVRAIIEQDAGMITSVPGIGQKTAARLLVELKDRVFEKGLADGMPASDGDSAGSRGESVMKSEVRAALLNLGFSAREGDKMLEGLGGQLDQAATVEEALKLVLRSK